MEPGQPSNLAGGAVTEGAVDDMYFSALLSEEGREEAVFPIADDKYAEAVQFQEVLIISSTTGSAKLKSENVNGAADQPSSTSSSFVVCTICTEETLGPEDMFRDKMSCSHLFCNACIARHIAAKVQENNISSLTCPEPGCRAAIEPEHCKGVIPDLVFDRWCDVLCESIVLSEAASATKTNELKSTHPSSLTGTAVPSNTSNMTAIDGVIYCPFSDCSTLLIFDDSDEQVSRAECPSCHRLFCAQCKVSWHATAEAEYTCEEYQRCNGEDAKKLDCMLVDLAEGKHWKRCPCCKFFVEKKDGCIHIICRCKFEFCYGCGAAWANSHFNTCQK